MAVEFLLVNVFVDVLLMLVLGAFYKRCPSRYPCFLDHSTLLWLGIL